uniref:DCN1-like protein n=1 Tax=Sus scrofa TaxID=9823 RepID=A0A8D1XA42_PIG
LKGMRTHRCDCQSTLINKFRLFRKTLNNQSSFKNVYKDALDFPKDKKKQRILTLDTKNSLVTIILVRCYPFASFFHYHNQSKPGISNLDYWENLMSFNRTILRDIRNYQPETAWPTLLDYFVWWEKVRITY